jgi:hypothetical protein
MQTIQAPSSSATLVSNILASAAKTPYQAPNVVSFPIDGMSIAAPLSLAGNVGAA